MVTPQADDKMEYGALRQFMFDFFRLPFTDL
jgi:hypothetical protein